MLHRTLSIFALSLLSVPALAQQYESMSGNLHTPSAEMNASGTARIGAHYISQEWLGESSRFTCPDDDGVPQKYDTFTYYLSITPFSWVEVGFTCTAFKSNTEGNRGYNSKDRHFSLKLNPLKEGKYYPALALGADDFMGSRFDSDKGSEQDQKYFGNYWIAATKHFIIQNQEIGLNVGYRHYLKDFNKKFQGVNAAITYRPIVGSHTARYIRPRALVEYDGTHVNVGADALLLNHFLLQLSLIDGKAISAGLCYQINLGQRGQVRGSRGQVP